MFGIIGRGAGVTTQHDEEDHSMRPAHFDQRLQPDRSCPEVFPDIPTRSKAFQPLEKSKTNPNSSRKPAPSELLSHAVDQAISDAMLETRLHKPATGPACSAVFPGVPPRSEAFPKTEKRETNPTVPDTDDTPEQLTPRQQVAARLLMQGMKSDAIAVQLQTTRQTINRWRHLPAMVVELQRLHDLLARSAAASANSARRGN